MPSRATSRPRFSIVAASAKVLPPAPRLARAGVTIAELRGLKEDGELAEQAEAFDRVLVDAPCSGTGTWRRQPDARWRVSVADLNRIASQELFAAHRPFAGRAARSFSVRSRSAPSSTTGSCACCFVSDSSWV